MASETPASPARSRALRIILVALGVIVLLLAGTAAFLAWVVGTESGARTALPWLLERSGGQVTVDGIRGRLVGPLQAQRVVVRTDGQRIELTDVRLRWNPRALIGERLLHIESLEAARLAVVTSMEQSDDKAELPADLALPIELQIDTLELGGGSIQRGPVTVATIGELALGLSYRDQQFALDLRRLGAQPQFDAGTARARVSGKLALNARRPYSLDGRFTLDSTTRLDERTLGAQGELVLDGSLAELKAALNLTVNGEPVTGQAVLTPFADTPLASAELHARALDLAAFDTTLPRTQLDIDLTAGEDGRGHLRVRNAAPAALSEQGIPLQALDLAFVQHEARIDFPTIEARLGAGKDSAGVLSGKGSFADGALQLALSTDRLNLARIDRQLRPTSLSGSAQLRHDDGKQSFELALAEPLGRQRLTLQLKGSVADNAVEIGLAELQAGKGMLRASGRVELDGALAFQAKGEVAQFNLHEFGRFEQVPSMNLNGGFAVEGVRSPQLQADLRLNIEDSQLSGQPLHGKGEARLRGERLEVPALTLVSGANRLTAEGQLAEEGSTLRFSIDAPKLDQLGGPFGGALFAKGTARGTLAKPALDIEWRAQQARLPGDTGIESMQGQADLRLDRNAPFMLGGMEASLKASGLRQGGQRVGRIDASLRFAPRPDAPLALDFDAHDVMTDAVAFERVRIEAEGTTGQHTINAAADEQGQAWRAEASGGLASLGSATQWEGKLAAFNAEGRIDARTRGAASLLLSGERIRIAELALDLDGGQLVLDHFERGSDGIATEGRITQLRVDRLLAFAGSGERIETDLQLSGAWDLRRNQTLDGSLTLQRDSGDVTVLGAEPVTLGLALLQAELKANDGQIALDMQARGERLGSVAVDVGTRLGQGGNPLALADDAPLSGNANFSIPALAWVGPLLSPALGTAGALQGDVTLAGSVRDPSISGRVNGTALRLAHPDLGLDLRNGTLRARFTGNTLQLEQLAFAGTQGNVALTGPISFGASPSAELQLRADQFAVLDRPDRRLVVSGASAITWRDERATVTGEFLVNSGFFDIGTGERPTLGSDVVIVGKEERKAAGMPLAMDVAVRLGDGVKVEGRGLDAVVGGQVRLLSKVGEPLEAIGTLRVLEGTYGAYGRELAIEEGTLRFTGPINNPALDILAMRRGQEVEAGVSVRGNVLSPRVTLVSEPNVPDADKLSWLVIGRSLANAGPNEIGSLQDAAASLLAQGAAAGVQSRIASAFGLDTFSIGKTQGSLQERIVTVGKQISSRLYVGYQHGLESAASVVQLRYILTPRLSVEAEAGARSALSLFYNITFD